MKLIKVSYLFINPNNPIILVTIGVTLRKITRNTARNAVNVLIVSVLDTNLSLWVRAKRLL